MRNAQVYRAAGKWTREARLVVPCTLTRMRSVCSSVGHHPRYCPAIMHDAQMRRCTGQPGMGRGKHAWSFHARSRACSVRGPGRPRTTRRGLLSFAQLSSCRPESIGRRERKPCGSRSGRKPSGTCRAERFVVCTQAERNAVRGAGRELGGWSLQAAQTGQTAAERHRDLGHGAGRTAAEREQDLVRLTSPGMHEERRQDAGTQAVRWESARSCWRVCCSWMA